MQFACSTYLQQSCPERLATPLVHTGVSESLEAWFQQDGQELLWVFLRHRILYRGKKLRRTVGRIWTLQVSSRLRQHRNNPFDDFDLIPQRFEICDEIHWDVLAELSNSSVESRSRRVNHARRRRRARANLRVRHRQHLAAIEGRRWRINSKLCIHHLNCNGFILDIDEMTRVFEQLREQEMISCVRGGQLRAARALR